MKNFFSFKTTYLSLKKNFNFTQKYIYNFPLKQKTEKWKKGKTYFHQKQRKSKHC